MINRIAPISFNYNISDEWLTLIHPLQVIPLVLSPLSLVPSENKNKFRSIKLNINWHFFGM